MDLTDPIRRVSAVSTGRVQIHPDHQGVDLDRASVPDLGLAQAADGVPALATV